MSAAALAPTCLEANEAADACALAKEAHWATVRAEVVDFQGACKVAWERWQYADQMVRAGFTEFSSARLYTRMTMAYCERRMYNA